MVRMQAPVYTLLAPVLSECGLPEMCTAAGLQSKGTDFYASNTLMECMNYVVFAEPSAEDNTNWVQLIPRLIHDVTGPATSNHIEHVCPKPRSLRSKLITGCVTTSPKMHCWKFAVIICLCLQGSTIRIFIWQSTLLDLPHSLAPCQQGAYILHECSRSISFLKQVKCMSSSSPTKLQESRLQHTRLQTPSWLNRLSER